MKYDNIKNVWVFSHNWCALLNDSIDTDRFIDDTDALKDDTQILQLFTKGNFQSEKKKKTHKTQEKIKLKWKRWKCRQPMFYEQSII